MDQAAKLQLSPTSATAQPSNHRDFIDWFQFLFKTIATIVAIIAAYQAWTTYKATNQQDLLMREHELKQKLFEHKLQVFDQAVSAAGDLVVCPPAEFQKRLDHFRVLKHGEIKMLGDIEIYNQMVKIYNTGFVMVGDHKVSSDSGRNELDHEFQDLSDLLHTKIQADLSSFAGESHP